MTQVVKGSDGQDYEFPDEATPQDIQEFLKGTAAPQPQAGPTKQAAADLPPMEDSDPIDAWMKQQVQTTPDQPPMQQAMADAAVESASPAGALGNDIIDAAKRFGNWWMGPKGQDVSHGVPIETTDENNLQNEPATRLGHLARTGLADAGIWAQAAPRNFLDFMRSDFNYDTGDNFNPMDDKITWTDPQPAAPDSWEAQHLPTTEQARNSLYSKLDIPETRSEHKSGQYFQQAVTGAALGAAAPGPFSPASVGSGAALTPMPQMLTDAGVDQQTAFEATLLAGLFGGKAATAPGRMVGDALDAYRKTPGTMAAELMPGVTQAQMDASTALMQRAAAGGRPLTRFEALNQVSDGQFGGLMDQQRYLEANSPELKQTMARRAGANATGVQDQARAIAGPDGLPQGPTKAGLPDRMGELGQGAMQEARTLRRDSTSELYQMADDTPIDEMMHDPALAARWGTILQRPQTAAAMRRVTEGRLPGDATPTFAENVSGTLRELQRDIGAEQTRIGGNLGPDDPLIRQRDELRSLANETLPGFERANDRFALLSHGLDTYEGGPVGGVAKTGERTTDLDQAGKAEAQSNALFKPDPRVVDPYVMRQHTGDLMRQPGGAGVVRQFLATEFDRAFKTAQGSIKDKRMKQGAGYKFSQDLQGDPDVGANLHAAIEQAAGPEVAQGVQNFLQELDAQGYRQAPGSPTGQNLQFKEAFETPALGVGREDVVQGGPAALLNMPTQVLKGLADRIRQGRHAFNVDGMVDLVMDPNNAQAWRDLANLNPRDPAFQRAAEYIAGALTPTGNAAKATGAATAGQQASPDWEN